MKRVEFELFRIAQEALQNAGKHADAQNVYINLTGHDTGEAISLTIEDDGRRIQWMPTGNPHWDSAI